MDFHQMVGTLARGDPPFCFSPLEKHMFSSELIPFKTNGEYNTCLFQQMESTQKLICADLASYHV